MTDHIFGPVHSRRLGKSLGIDVVPYKTCTYDCIYCQLGRTTCRTMERKEWLPSQAILKELDAKLSHPPPFDYLTFSGSGEPTLHSSLGRLIQEIKKRCTLPVAVLTNGALLWRQDVQDDLMAADLVMPSLDASNKGLFKYINRPHPDLEFDTVLKGLIRFRERYQGRLWLEIFLLAGINGLEQEARKLAGLTSELKPDLIQLMTVTRPPHEKFAAPVSREMMAAFIPLFDSPVMVVTKPTGLSDDFLLSLDDSPILGLLMRRPCTIQDISQGLRISTAEAGERVKDLFSHGQICRSVYGGEIYYHADYRMK